MLSSKALKFRGYISMTFGTNEGVNIVLIYTGKYPKIAICI